MGTIIREATANDFDRLLDLYEDLHRSEPRPDPALVADIYAKICQAEHLRLFVLEDEGQLRSSCYLSITENLSRGGRPYGVIENVVTDAEHRGRGLAKAVIGHALAFAWEQGCYKVMLLTGRDDIAGFYEACGFRSDEKQAFIARP